MTLEEYLKSQGAQYNEDTHEFITNLKGEPLDKPIYIKGDMMHSWNDWERHHKEFTDKVFRNFNVYYDVRLNSFHQAEYMPPFYLYFDVINNNITNYIKTYDITGLVKEEKTGNYTKPENCVKIGEYYILTKYAYRYALCKQCGALIDKDYERIDSQGLCDVCVRDAKAEVCGYHAHKRKGLKKYYGADKENFKGYGIELECEANRNTNYNTNKCRTQVRELLGDRVYFEQDGSLRNDGFETITRPHTKEELLGIDWRKVLQIYVDNGCLSHTTNRCGLHIHASRTLFGKDKETQDENIAKVIFFYEYFWSDIVRYSRRTNFGYCDKLIRNEDVTEKRVKELSKTKSYRYCPVNTSPDHTVEFRIPRGTLKYETFIATLDFTIKIVENASKMKWSEITDHKKWLKGINNNTRTYLNKRRAFTDKEYKTNPRNVGEI